MGTEQKKEEDKPNAEDKLNEEGFVGEELEEYGDPLPLQEAIEEYIKGETRTAIGAGSPILAPFYENKREGESNVENAGANTKETERDVDAPQETTMDVRTTQDLQLRDQKIGRKTKKSGGIKGFFHKVASWFTKKLKKEPKGQDKIKKERHNVMFASLAEAAEVKKLVLPSMQRIKDLDILAISDCTEEELIAKNAELQELYNLGKQITDAGKYPDPDQPKMTIKDAFFHGNVIEKEQFDLKCGALIAYAQKAHMLCLMKEYEKGTLTEECFTEGELLRIRSSFGQKEGEPLDMKQMYSYVKDKYIQAMNFQKAVLSRYIKNPQVQDYYMGDRKWPVEIRHVEYMSAINEMRKDAKEELKLKEGDTVNADTYKAYYQICSQKEVQLKEKIDGAASEEIPKLQEELQKLRQRKQEIQMQYALNSVFYARAGEESLLKEQLFRSFDGVESIPAFRAMSEEDFRQMCLQLSAGALEEDLNQPERKEYYYQQNQQGLLTYKEHMREHYEMMEERFHHRVPSIEYIIEHEMELLKLVSGGQVDHHLVDRLDNFLDLKKPEDQRLYHLAQVYHSIGIYIDTILKMLTINGLDYEEANEWAGNAIKDSMESFRYLENNRKN